MSVYSRKAPYQVGSIVTIEAMPEHGDRWVVTRTYGSLALRAQSDLTGAEKIVSAAQVAGHPIDDVVLRVRAASSPGLS